MEKKIICVLVTIVLVTLASCGSKTDAEDFAFQPYTEFTGAQTQDLQIDEGITLDGVLDEKIWTVNTPMKIKGVTKDQTTNGKINTNVYGDRSATVYTYIGEKNVYFAFDVNDKNLYYDSHTDQSSNTCVELYFTNGDNTKMGKGCYSIRVNPTGKEGSAAANAQIYVPNDAVSEWSLSTAPGMYAAAITVDGTVCNKPNDSSYSTKGNKGYVVEIAVSKSLIGKNVQSIRFTAAFVQDKGFALASFGTSFISGTSYNNPNMWTLVKSKGEK